VIHRTALIDMPAAVVTETVALKERETERERQTDRQTHRLPRHNSDPQDTGYRYASGSRKGNRYVKERGRRRDRERDTHTHTYATQQ